MNLQTPSFLVSLNVNDVSIAIFGPLFLPHCNYFTFYSFTIICYTSFISQSLLFFLLRSHKHGWWYLNWQKNYIWMGEPSTPARDRLLTLTSLVMRSLLSKIYFSVLCWTHCCLYMTVVNAYLQLQVYNALTTLNKTDC